MPSLENAVKIAKALNVSVEFLATGMEANQHNKKNCAVCLKYQSLIKDLEAIPQNTLLPIKELVRALADTKSNKTSTQ